MNLKKANCFPKELSWLSFNERVLQEAADPTNPVVERLRFLGIYSNNMDEFYRVRVADVKRLIYIYLAENDHDNVALTEQLMEDIHAKVLQLTKRFHKIYQQLVKELARYHIFLINGENINQYQADWIKEYFRDHVICHITPIMLDQKVDLIKRLNDTATYFFVRIHRPPKSPLYAIVEMPSQAISRFVVIPPEKSKKNKYIILLDDIIRLHIKDIFKGFVSFNKIETYSFKMTRDAEYSINNEIDESYVEKMSDSMKQRLVAEPVRCLYDSHMPEDMLKALTKRLNFSSYDSVIAGGPYRNFKDFIRFPNIGRSYLENPPLQPIHASAFAAFDTTFDAITHQDILLYYPYHRFSHFTEFIRQAAFDPKVKHIRLNVYRIASRSRIINSLIDAVANGKKVTVVVELKARFDEQANINWSKKMTDAGIKVILGIASLKIHSKLCVVTREEKGQQVLYAHIGTGNFNETTAEIYTDFSFFTRQEGIAREALSVFDLIQYPYSQIRFDHLQVSPINAREKITALVEEEIKAAKQGKSAEITLKINNLVDPLLIKLLYRASQSGVLIRAIVRGMCSLTPGIKGLSENIFIVSIVDRFLEHARVMVFKNKGKPKVFITSADWMTRNMDSRIEVGCPIYDKKLAKLIIDILDLQLKDTVKSRLIDQQQQNRYIKRGNKRKIRSQSATYRYLSDLEGQQLK